MWNALKFADIQQRFKGSVLRSGRHQQIWQRPAPETRRILVSAKKPYKYKVSPVSPVYMNWEIAATTLRSTERTSISEKTGSLRNARLCQFPARCAESKKGRENLPRNSTSRGEMWRYCFTVPASLYLEKIVTSPSKKRNYSHGWDIQRLWKGNIPADF